MTTNSFGPPPSIAKKSPYTWNVNEVAAWIASLNYQSESKHFQTALIDGSKLFGLDRTSLQNHVRILDGMLNAYILFNLYSI